MSNCQSNYSYCRVTQMKLLLLLISLFSFFLATQAADTCGICTDVAFVAELYVRFEGWNATYLDSQLSNICTYLGFLQDDCLGIFATVGLEFSECLVKLDSTVNCCADIELCQTPRVRPSRSTVMKVKQQLMEKFKYLKQH